jgi:tetratricopeptide (TPR) repeat protein
MTKKNIPYPIALCGILCFILIAAPGCGGKETKETENTALKNYEIAKKNFEVNPNEENTIWLGRRAAYLGKLKEAIDIYTRGLQNFPASYKLYRHRGHRYISKREFRKAIADFKVAALLIKDIPLEVEPDGLPNAANIPLSNTQFNIWYHLGLAYYLTGDFEQAVLAYRECLNWCKNDDSLVATTHWLYMTYRRMGDKISAEKLLEPITENMTIIEDYSYYDLVLMYKGLKTPESLLNAKKDRGTDPALANVTMGYGIGNWYYYNDQKEKAKEIFGTVLKSKSKLAFAYIAAETDINRTQ